MVAVDKLSKQEIKEQFGISKNDSGSDEVQIALLTARVIRLTRHLQINKKDFSGRRGLLMILGQRSSKLSYLKRKNSERYHKLISTLGLKDKA